MEKYVGYHPNQMIEFTIINNGKNDMFFLLWGTEKDITLWKTKKFKLNVFMRNNQRNQIERHSAKHLAWTLKKMLMT